MSETEEQRIRRILRQARETVRPRIAALQAGEQRSVGDIRFHSHCESPFTSTPTPEQLNEYWRNY